MNSIEDGKNTAISMVCNTITSVISIIVSLVTTIIITKIISLADLGIATSFMTLKNILTIICLCSLYITINRMLLDVQEKKYEYLSSIYIFSSITCIILFLIYLVFHNFFNHFLGFDIHLMILMFSMIFFINGCTILTNYWSFKNKYRLMFVYNLLASPISQICSLLFAYLIQNKKYLGRIIGLDIFNVLFGIGCGIFILYKGKCKLNKNYVKSALKISLPMIPHLLSQILLASCDLLMIKNIVGSSEAGLYSMSYTIANILYTVLIQLFMPWSPWVYRRLHKNEITTIKINSKLLMTLAGYLCLGLMTVSPEMIRIFLSDKYIPSIYLVAPICVGIFYQMMYTFFYDIEYFYKKNKQIAFFSIITAILNIGLNYIFINVFGYRAAAYTTLVSYFLLLILHFIGMKRIEKRNIYDHKYLFCLGFIIFCISLFYHFFNYNLFYRYAILLISTLVLILKYKKEINEVMIIKLKDRFKNK